MSRTLHHRRRPRRDVGGKGDRLDAKPQKRPGLWKVEWNRSLNETERRRMHGLFVPLLDFGVAVYAGAYDIAFRPWNYKDVLPAILQVVKRVGPPDEWNLGEQTPPWEKS